MTIKFNSQALENALVMQNFENKGFALKKPTLGCSYVMQPPKEYQELFQNLQDKLRQAALPTSNVRIPHATVIAAKVIDKKDEEEWKDLEEVQKVYRSFLVFQVHKEMEASGSSYESAVNTVLTKDNSDVEQTLAAISKKTNKNDALRAIKEVSVRESVEKILDSDKRYNCIKEAALRSINMASFQLKITEVALTSKGSINFQLEENPKLLQMRLDLIIAGQGISKWTNLSETKDAWSTVAFTTRTFTDEEEKKLNCVLAEWTEQHQEELKKVNVHFDSDHLGLVAFRINDLSIDKKVLFPIGQRARPVIPKLDLTKIVVSEEDLHLTPHAGSGGITPIAGNRNIPNFGKEDWSGSINKEVTVS
jgi:hypothetical protein